MAPLAVLLLLSACATILKPFGREAPTPEGVLEDPAAPTELSQEVDAAPDEETTDVEEIAAAPEPARPPSANGFLGETVVALGDPAKPGFWLMTPLVDAERPGRLEREGGAVVEVTLIPLDVEAGAGSQISLSAMRALDIPITGLIALRVFSG